MSRQIILDTETTGISPAQGHRIIEVGCVEMINRQVTRNHFHQYINPEREIDQGAVKVHGLTTHFLSDKPTFDAILHDLLDFIRGADLVIHNAPFDIGFLNHELKLCGSKVCRVEEICTVTDTLVIARNKHPGQRNSLDALCQRYQVDNSNRDLHGALLDSELLAQVYLQLTGGQTQLFAEESSGSSTSPTVGNVVRVDSQRESLVVLQPSEEELQAHREYLQKIQQQGQCVWHDLQNTQKE